MKLTDEEQRQLHELELAFSREDPELVRRLRGGRRIRLPRLPVHVPAISGFAVGASLLVAGLVVLFAVLAVSPVAALGAYGMMFGGTWLMLAAPSTQRACARLLGRVPNNGEQASDTPGRQR